MDSSVITAIVAIVPTSITAILGVANFVSTHKNKKVVDAIDSKISPISTRLRAAEKKLEQVSQDTTRIQMMDEIHRHPKNKDTIFRIAERYFVEQQGNWVATNEFVKWAKEQNAVVPSEILKAMEGNSGI